MRLSLLPLAADLHSAAAAAVRLLALFPCERSPGELDPPPVAGLPVVRARSFVSFVSFARLQSVSQTASQPASRLPDRQAKNGLVTSLTTTTTAPAAAARRQRDSTGATKHNGTRKVIIEPGERFFRSFKAFLLGLPALAGSAAEIFRLPGAAAHLAAQGRRQLSAGCTASPRLRSALLALA